MSNQKASLRLILATISFLTLSIYGDSPSGPAERELRCENASSVNPNETLFINNQTASSIDFYMVDIPDSGILSIHASNPEGQGGTPSLYLSPSACRAQVPEAVHRPVQQTPRSLLRHIVSPGRFSFAVTSEDGAPSLLSYKLQVTFTEAQDTAANRIFLDANPPESCLESNPPVFGEDPGFADGLIVLERSRSVVLKDDVEPVDCDILDGNFSQPGVVVFESAGVPVAANIFEGKACAPIKRIGEAALGDPGSTMAAAIHAGPHRLTLAPLTTSPVEYSLSVRHFDLCSRANKDDHGDTPVCATPIEVSERAFGRMDDQLGGDEDHFTFILESQQTLSIEVAGGKPLSLFDSRGQRLASATAEDMSATSRIVRTLSPGRYYLEITGSSSVLQEYNLSLFRASKPQTD